MLSHITILHIVFFNVIDKEKKIDLLREINKIYVYMYTYIQHTHTCIFEISLQCFALQIDINVNKIND